MGGKAHTTGELILQAAAGFPEGQAVQGKQVQEAVGNKDQLIGCGGELADLLRQCFHFQQAGEADQRSWQFSHPSVFVALVGAEVGVQLCGEQLQR